MKRHSLIGSRMKGQQMGYNQPKKEQNELSNDWNKLILKAL